MWGSISIAQLLMKAGLIDEYRLVVCPMVLGDGRPLFATKIPLNMSLSAAETMDRGAVYLTYAQQEHSSAAAGSGKLQATT